MRHVWRTAPMRTRWSEDLWQGLSSRRRLLTTAGALGLATRLPGWSATTRAAARQDGSQTQGGTLTIAYDEEEASLDFPKATRTSGRVAFSMNMGDGLFFMDETGTPVP